MSADYKDLKVWQKSISLANDLYKITEKFPKEEQFGLTNQLRRAVVSISSNIAEGSGRETSKDFAHFVSIAKGSLREIETQLIIANNLDFIDSDKLSDLQEEITELDKMLFGLRKSLKEKK